MGNLQEGSFSFKHSMYLPIEKMIADGRLRSLDGFVHELITAARDVSETQPLQAGAFEVSDRIAWTRGRRVTGDVIRKKFLGDASRIFDELRPFAVCDLSR